MDNIHAAIRGDGAVLDTVQQLARRLEASHRTRVGLIEVGANLGDCLLWAVQRLRAVPSLLHIDAVGYEAIPAASELLERSVRLNGLEVKTAS